MNRSGRTRQYRSPLALTILGILMIGGIGFYAKTALFLPVALGDPNDIDQVKHGWQVYAQACAKCHGEDLRGEFGFATSEMVDDAGKFKTNATIADATVVAPAHDASGKTWRHSDQDLFRIVKFGEAADVKRPVQKRMPALKDKLTDGEIWMTIALIKSSWPPEILKIRASNDIASRYCHQKT